MVNWASANNSQLNLFKLQQFSSKELDLKRSSAERRSFRFGLNLVKSNLLCVEAGAPYGVMKLLKKMGHVVASFLMATIHCFIPHWCNGVLLPLSIVYLFVGIIINFTSRECRSDAIENGLIIFIVFGLNHFYPIFVLYSHLRLSDHMFLFYHMLMFYHILVFYPYVR